MRKVLIKVLSIAACGLGMVLAMQSSHAQDTAILNDDTAAQADVQALKTEAELFEKIKNGVMLNLAECDLTKTCKPAVNADEVQRILLKLDSRITALTARYNKTNETDLESVILTYADARQGYARALDKLDAIAGPEEGKDIYNDTGSGSSGGDLNNLFNDSGEDVQ